jgi:Glycosyl hydrolases family 18
MPMGGEPGRRRLSGWAKPTLAAAVAILAGGGVWLAVPDTSPGQSGFTASLRLPLESPGAQSPGARPSVDRRTSHDTDPPAASCASTSLAGASGAWLADWLDDAGRPSLIPSQARQLGLLDFYWVRLGADPGSLSLQHGAPGAQSLGSALGAAATANPCGLRFITVSDDLTTKSVMAKILADPRTRQRNIDALTALMADYPQADGLTLDYEYALPSTRGDLATYAAVNNWHGLTASEEVSRISAQYTEFVRELATALHQARRELRVAVGVRTTNELNLSYVKPFVYDYGQLATYADQIVLMAIDFHSPGSDPGPIVTVADVASVLKEVQAYGIPAARLAIESAVYAYDWTVNAAGHRLAGTKATSLTATEVTARHWPVAGGDDGESRYAYTASGKRHEVWYAGSGLQYQAGQLRTLCPGCGIVAWATGNTDPVGSGLILRALG